MFTERSRTNIYCSKNLTCSIHSLDSGGEGKEAKIITPTYRYVNPTRKYAIERSLTWAKRKSYFGQHWHENRQNKTLMRTFLWHLLLSLLYLSLFNIYYYFFLLLKWGLQNWSWVRSESRKRIPQSGSRQVLFIYLHTEKAWRNRYANRCNTLLLDAQAYTSYYIKQTRNTLYFPTFNYPY